MSELEFTESLGFRDVGMLDGAFVIELDIGRRHLSRAERVHGGVLFSLLDTALGRAVIEELPPGQTCATVEIKINYLRFVQQGLLRAAGRCLHKTRTLAYAEGQVMSEEGKVLARATGTFILIDPSRRPDR